MNPILKNVLAVIAGMAVGSVVNMGLIMISGAIIPPPLGVDLSSPEGLKLAMPLFETKHFIFPFLAHAMGTLVGAFLAFKIAVTHKMKFSLLIGVLFSVGGIMMVLDMPAPLWFEALDLIIAYLPMAYLGAYLAKR